MREIFESDSNVLCLDRGTILVVQVCAFVQTQWTIYLRFMHFIVDKFYLKGSKTQNNYCILVSEMPAKMVRAKIQCLQLWNASKSKLDWWINREWVDEQRANEADIMRCLLSNLSGVYMNIDCKIFQCFCLKFVIFNVGKGTANNWK